MRAEHSRGDDEVENFDFHPALQTGDKTSIGLFTPVQVWMAG